MVTFYIDVYFLINFTVDTLAVAFAGAFSGIPQRRARAILSAAFGAVFAVITVLMPEYISLKAFSGLFGLLAVVALYSAGVSFKRKIRFALAFLVFCGLIGGVVSYLFGLFESMLGSSFYGLQAGGTNRKLLLIAIAVLISIGVFKMIVAFFGGKVASGFITVQIDIGKLHYEADGLIDSGNLAVDPMDSSPIILIKEDAAKGFLPDTLIQLSDPDLLDSDIRRRVRLIPISTAAGTKVLTGIKPERITLKVGEKFEEIRATLAIDREGGDFGGYGLLVPSAVVCDVGK